YIKINIPGTLMLLSLLYLYSTLFDPIAQTQKVTSTTQKWRSDFTTITSIRPIYLNYKKQKVAQNQFHNYNRGGIQELIILIHSLSWACLWIIVRKCEEHRSGLAVVTSGALLVTTCRAYGVHKLARQNKIEKNSEVTTPLKAMTRLGHPIFIINKFMYDNIIYRQIGKVYQLQYCFQGILFLPKWKTSLIEQILHLGIPQPNQSKVS
ncbi:hypothetical protein ACJX0J_040373, partial [Zea mays]